jgi:hypothetical protein
MWKGAHFNWILGSAKLNIKLKFIPFMVWDQMKKVLNLQIISASTLKNTVIFIIKIETQISALVQIN